MGWIWRDDDNDEVDSNNSSFLNPNPNPNPNPNSGDNCSTRKIVRSHCNTVEVEPGKFVRKCEKTEQILRDCVGKPTEIIQSNKEYTEDDVTDEMKKGLPFSRSADSGPFDMPGLRSDIEGIERSIFGSLNRFFEAADEISNGFFRILDGPSPSVKRRGMPIEVPIQEEPKTNTIVSDSGSVDLSGLARDV